MIWHRNCDPAILFGSANFAIAASVDLERSKNRRPDHLPTITQLPLVKIWWRSWDNYFARRARMPGWFEKRKSHRTSAENADSRRRRRRWNICKEERWRVVHFADNRMITLTDGHTILTSAHRSLAGRAKGLPGIGDGPTVKRGRRPSLRSHNAQLRRADGRTETFWSAVGRRECYTNTRLVHVYIIARLRNLRKWQTDGQTDTRR